MSNSDAKRSARRVLLPYCLMRLQDGRYVATNRQYKPIGSIDTSWADYERLPETAKLTIPAKLIPLLNYRARTDDDRIYLYGDESVPTKSAANWAAYAERLRLLATCDAGA